MPLTRRNLIAGSVAALPFSSTAVRSAFAAQRNTDALIVETTGGAIRGAQEGDIAVFRGIPFAAAPAGKLRFKAPQPHTRWRGVRDATQFGPICPQNPSRLNQVMGNFDAPQAEDNCLTLNVWTATLKAEPAPVMIWIHGGGFVSGSGSLAWYSGQHFVQNGGIVVVTINYRVGPFGFMYLPGVSDGNMGILDQRMALGWVKDNIARFGGDPNNITIAGQSGGGRSVAIHMAAKETNGMFRRGILQSPAIGVPPTVPERAAERAHEYVALLKLEKPEAIMKVPVEKLLTTFGELSRQTKRFANTVGPFGIVRDGKVFAADPVDALLQGAGVGIDLLIGTTRDESGAHFSADKDVLNATEAQVLERFQTTFGDQAELYLDEYRRRLPNATPYALLVHLVTDLNYERKSLAIAEERAKQGHPGYVFRFDWQSPKKLFGAAHTLELPFVFNNLENWTNSPMLAGADRQEMEALSRVMHRAWIQFIKTGNPNHDGIAPWAPYDATNRTTMRFDTMVEPVGDLAGLRWRRSWIVADA